MLHSYRPSAVMYKRADCTFPGSLKDFLTIRRGNRAARAAQQIAADPLRLPVTAFQQAHLEPGRIAMVAWPVSSHTLTCQ